jgi:CheY-like chemotaxis protein
VIADFVADHPVLTVFAVVLVLLLPIVLALWLRRRRAVRLPTLPPRTLRPDPAPLPALSLDSFAPLPPRAARPAPAPPSRPAAPATPVSAPAGATPVPQPAEPAGLLVVDDSAVARVLLRKLFEAAGHRVDVAADGEEALALLDSKRYAVLVTDLEMPKLNGFELIAAVQASPAGNDLPIIAITGHEELSARVHDMKGLYGIFKKPWNETELLQRVTNLARLRRLAANG